VRYRCAMGPDAAGAMAEDLLIAASYPVTAQDPLCRRTTDRGGAARRARDRDRRCGRSRWGRRWWSSERRGGTVPDYRLTAQRDFTKATTPLGTSARRRPRARRPLSRISTPSEGAPGTILDSPAGDRARRKRPRGASRQGREILSTAPDGRGGPSSAGSPSTGTTALVLEWRGRYPGPRRGIARHWGGVGLNEFLQGSAFWELAPGIALATSRTRALFRSRGSPRSMVHLGRLAPC